MHSKGQRVKGKEQKLHNILLEIVERKKQDLAHLVIPSEERAEGSQTTKQPVGRRFLDSISVARNDINIIAEIKFSSPTNSSLGSKEELLTRAKKYEEAGADAISIITEQHFFKGDVTFISQVKNEVSIPVLQKDFVIDEYQIYQAKAIGSDALLLIARLVRGEELKKFVSLCQELGIEPVVEINSKEDLEKAVATGTTIIAVNARDLETFAVDVASACDLMKKIPDNFIALGFSGINSKIEVEQYKKAGAKGVLVGTSLMKANDICGFITSLREGDPSASSGQAPQSQMRSPRGVQSSEWRTRDDNSVKVKICGVRTLESARAALAAGADFLGFNFVPTSKRLIDMETAEKIISEVHGKIQTVGVFQNAPVDEVNKTADMLDLDFVQLHGEEDAEYMKKIKRKIIKRYNSDSHIDANKNFIYVLLDREVQGVGEMVNVDKAVKISNRFLTFFSGGLTPENVAGIIRNVRPYAVDVAGGIETEGKIDIKKIKAFITNAKEVTL